MFDVICCYVCRPQEEQVNQDGVVMAECATKYNHAESVMVVGETVYLYKVATNNAWIHYTYIGTRTFFKAFMIQGT